MEEHRLIIFMFSLRNAEIKVVFYSEDSSPVAQGILGRNKSLLPSKECSVPLRPRGWRISGAQGGFLSPEECAKKKVILLAPSLAKSVSLSTGQVSLLLASPS